MVDEARTIIKLDERDDAKSLNGSVVVMYKPYDEKMMVRTLPEITHSLTETREGMADHMNKMMGIPSQTVSSSHDNQLITPYYC